MRRIICPVSPNLPGKPLSNKLSTFKFYVALGTFYVAIDLKIENLVLEIWFVLTQLNKCTLGCARTLSEASCLSTRSICFTVLMFGVPFTFQMLLSARNLTPNWEHIYKMCLIPSILKIKNTAFLYLPGMDSTDTAGVLHHTRSPQSTSTYMKCCFFAQISKWVGCLSILTCQVQNTKLLESVLILYIFSVFSMI